MAQDSPRGPVRIVVTGEQPAIIPIGNSLKEEKREASIHFRNADSEYHLSTSQLTRELRQDSNDQHLNKDEKDSPHQASLIFFAAGAATSILTVVVLGCFWALGKGTPSEQLTPILRGILEPLITSLVGIISGAIGTYFLTRKGKKD